MNTFYQVTAKFIRRDENGKDKKASATYLLDAINFTEAETKIHTELASIVSGEFTVAKIAKSTISEVIPSEGNIYYKSKIAFVVLDENSGKSKRVTQQILVMADSVDDADEKVSKAFENTTLGIDIVGVSESSIIEVFE